LFSDQNKELLLCPSTFNRGDNVKYTHSNYNFDSK
jgi:hypothetical protein